MAEKNLENSGGGSSTVFKVGAISLAFLIIGYEAALFMNRATQLRIAERRDHPDTVYVMDEALASRLLVAGGTTRDTVPDSRAPSGIRTESGRSPDSGKEEPGSGIIIRKDAEHPAAVAEVRENTRKVESFRFNPNTASEEELVRLGFSAKQAASIIKYRNAGGRFRRKSDFAKSFVVSDSIYRRLEKYIDIPLLDINKADSAAFDALPGIGGWFASRMVEYRNRLGGYSCKEQLMEIYHFDQEKFDGLKDLVCCGRPETPFGLWSLPVDELRRHPHIRNYQTAKAIVLFREKTPREGWSVDALESNGIISAEDAAGLRLCLIQDP